MIAGGSTVFVIPSKARNLLLAWPAKADSSSHSLLGMTKHSELDQVLDFHVSTFPRIAELGFDKARVVVPVLRF